MFGRLGIIPAAGKAERFGGYPKELLLGPDGQALLLRTYKTMKSCDAVVVITRPDRVAMHMEILPDAIFLQQRGFDLWGAVKTALKLWAVDYVMAMPDTFYPDSVFERPSEDNLILGLFETDTPERFGVYSDHQIQDKDETLKGTTQKAWGVLMWNDDIAEVWRNNHYSSFDKALNKILKYGRHSTFNMDYYFDTATFSDYKGLICG